MDFSGSKAVHAEWIEPSTNGTGLEAWIDHEYLPSAEMVSGVAHAERLEASNGAGLVLVWLDDVTRHADIIRLSQALREREQGRVGDDGGLYLARSSFGDIRSTPVVFAVRLRVKVGAEQDAVEWLDGEHAPRQLAVAGAINFRGFERTGRVAPFLNLWGLENSQITSSEAWTSRRDTPWHKRFFESVQGTSGAQYMRSKG